MFLSTASTVLTSIGVFTLVTILLVWILLFAKSKLSPSGPVKLNINGEISEVESGNTLLSTLSNNKIFLPSACGGGGTCGMCRCQVTDGGGEILPTETGFFNRKQIQDNWRLGCQVKVKGDMTVKVPEEIFGIKKWECEVVSNYNVASFIKEFVVKLPEGESVDFRAGGYVQLECPPHEVHYKDFDIQPEYRGEAQTITPDLNESGAEVVAPAKPAPAPEAA